MSPQRSAHWLLTALLLCTAVFLLAANAPAALSDAEWSAMKEAARNRVRRILYENDGDDCLAYPAKLEPSVEGYLAQRTSFLHKYPVDTVFYTPTEAGLGHVSLTIEHADPLVNQPRDFNPGASTKNIYPYLKSIGTDTLTEQLTYARAHGIELFCDIRMNDVHDSADRPDKPHLLMSPFKRNHPEYLFSTWDNPPPYGAWSSLDYGTPQVREYFLAHVTDIARKYPVDGICFDFHRQPRLFRTVAFGAVATDEQRGYITELFRKIRRLTEEAGRAHGRPQLVAVRVPDSIGFCHDMGLDLEALLSEGLVDIAIFGGNFRLNPWIYSKKLCDTYGVKMYPSIDMAQFTPDYSYRLSRYAFMTYYGRIAAAFQAGVEGCYYFNLFGEGGCQNIMRPSLDSIRLESKRYHLTDRWLERKVLHLKTAPKYEVLPHLHPDTALRLEAGKPVTFPLEFGDDVAALKAEGRQVDVRGVIKSRTLRDNAVQVTSNGKQWQFLGYDDQFLYYRLPDGAMLPGLNQLTLEATDPGKGAVGMVTIMSGKELLRGAKQSSWRRLWDRTRNDEAETIVDGAYCLSDFGKGMANFYYPLTGWDANIVMEFDFKLGDSSETHGVGVRIANGKHYEALLFGKESLRLEIAGVEAPFKTTNRFHNYRIRINGDKVYVDADGKQLLAAPLTARVNDPRADYAGSSASAYASADMHEKGIVLGALSDEGTSVSYWKHVKLRTPAGGAVIQDLAVEVLISKPVTPSPVLAWAYTSQAPGNALPCGNHAYSREHLAAEADFTQMPPDGTKLILSNGGTYFTALFSAGTLTASDGRSVVLPEGSFTIRAEESGSMSMMALADGTGTDLLHAFVSPALESGTFAALPDTERDLIRRGGLLLLPPANAKGTAVAAALRGAWVKPLTPIPAFTPVVAYDAADGIPAAPWNCSYVKDNCHMTEDGRLYLCNDHEQQYQAINLKDGELLKRLGRKPLLSTRFTMAKAPTGNNAEFYTLLLARVDDDGEHQVVIRVAPDHIRTNFGTAKAGFDMEGSHELTVELEFATNQARLWLDGEMLVKGEAETEPSRKEGCLMFGDGSGTCGGAVIVENIQAGPAEE